MTWMRIIGIHMWRCARLAGRSDGHWSYWRTVSPSGVSPTKPPAGPRSSSPVSSLCESKSIYWPLCPQKLSVWGISRPAVIVFGHTGSLSHWILKQDMLFNISHSLCLCAPHPKTCSSLFVNPIFNPLNNRCCLASVSSIVSVMSSSKRFDFPFWSMAIPD